MRMRLAKGFKGPLLGLFVHFVVGFHVPTMSHYVTLCQLKNSLAFSRQTRDVPGMTTSIRLFALVCLLGFSGCASPNPAFNPAQPPSASNPPYVPNQTVTGIAATGNAIAPAVPAPWGTIITGALALATAIATGVAYQKNGALTAAQATTAQIAASVAAQGPAVAQAVVQHASNNDAVAPAVFAAINANLPPDKISPS